METLSENAAQKPREKALKYGFENLSEAELLAIILRCGSKKQTALNVSFELLSKFSNLRKLSLSTIAELKRIHGVGMVKALEIKACLELARRFGQISLSPGECLGGTQKVFGHFHELLRDERKEKFFAILLDCKHRIIKKELVSIGSLNISIVHPREVFSMAIRECAVSVLLVHNHPSGDPTPSPEDILLTKRLIRVGNLVGIEVLDHMVIGNGSYFSFLEENMLKE